MTWSRRPVVRGAPKRPDLMTPGREQLHTRTGGVRRVDHLQGIVRGYESEIFFLSNCKMKWGYKEVLPFVVCLLLIIHYDINLTHLKTDLLHSIVQ